ncbi:N-acetylmuramoyl-L-alanine amidase [bacterium]|nr:N-acetylmuramoyl-L-alanine amidase [candidate division CSSED10-310 bacterium]
MQEPTTVTYAALAIPLGAALGFSITIERILELLSNVMDIFFPTNNANLIPSGKEADDAHNEMLKKQNYNAIRKENENDSAKKIDELTKRIEIETDQAKRNELKKELAAAEKESPWDEKHQGIVILVQDATDPDEGNTLKHFIAHAIGFALGILFAHFAQIKLFTAFMTALGNHGTIPIWLDYIFTGLLIGGGSAPIHFLIGFITHRKIVDPDNVETKDSISPQQSSQGTAVTSTAVSIAPDNSPPSAAPSAPALIITNPGTANWIDIPYTGGVDAVVLESIHVRQKKPDSIYYHHTAMSSSSTFDDVVKTIKNHTDKNGNHWVTGYHCVILSDGSISPFCRWDRYGNHATGYNMNSLGIAFNGNFETNPKIPFSNPDGRCGEPRPTEVQLVSGGRIVALWSLVYGIPCDFNRSIMPHNKVSDKTCPGTQFPYDQFKRIVEDFITQWNKSPTVMEKIEQFKIKPFVFDKGWGA